MNQDINYLTKMLI